MSLQLSKQPSISADELATHLPGIVDICAINAGRGNDAFLRLAVKTIAPYAAVETRTEDGEGTRIIRATANTNRADMITLVNGIMQGLKRGFGSLADASKIFGTAVRIERDPKMTVGYASIAVHDERRLKVLTGLLRAKLRKLDKTSGAEAGGSHAAHTNGVGQSNGHVGNGAGNGKDHGNGHAEPQPEPRTPAYKGGGGPGIAADVVVATTAAAPAQLKAT